METYLGKITVYIPQNLDDNYVSGSTSVRQTLINLADHDHSIIGLPINGATAIQAGSITGDRIADGTITGAKLDFDLSANAVANNTYITWRNSTDTADVNVIKLNASNQLELDPKIAKLVLDWQIPLQSANSSGTPVPLVSIDASNNCAWLTTLYTQHLYPSSTNTYDLGTTGSLYRDIHFNRDIYLGATKFYETSTWVPALTFGGGSTGLTYASRSGSYVRVGKLVFCTFTWGLSAEGSSNGTLEMSGLPFPIAAASTANGHITVYSGMATGVAGYSIGVTGASSSSKVNFPYANSTTSAATADMDRGTTTNTSAVIGYFSYLTD